MGNSESIIDKECICKNSNKSNKWIICDGCLQWFHPDCVSLTNEKFEKILSKNKKWFCDNHDCQVNSNMSSSSKNSSADTLTCTECGFIPKNSRGLKTHMRKHKKSQDQTPIDLIEFLHLVDEDNNNSSDNINITISSADQNFLKPQLINEENSSELVPCLLCKDNKLYKRKGGLKIHCVRKHKNEDYSIMFSQSSSGKSFDVTSLSDKISYYKRNIRVLKRIPKGARMTAAYELAKIIEKTVTHNDLSSWEELLLFSYKAFQIPENNKKNLTKVVKNNINSDTLEPSFKKFSNKQALLSKRVESKIAEGDVRGAVKLLSSSDELVKDNEETYRRLLAKHPSPSRIIEFPKVEDDLKHLIVDEKQVYTAIFSFPNGSASGIDGLQPQHLKDMICKSNGEASVKLITAITRLSNLMLSGKVNEDIIPIIYGANLCALSKKANDVRPIAVGCTLRRLTSKMACRSEFGHTSEVLFPKQVGVAIKGGCEAAVHSVRSHIQSNLGSKKIMVKVDLRNAFNSLERDDLLKGILKSSPSLYRFFYQCYYKPTTLFFGNYRISSEVGVQQGDPSGPLIFSEAIQPIIEEIKSELNIWFLDDGTLIGEVETVKHDLIMIQEKFKSMGLDINFDKCELFALSDDSNDEIEEINKIFPGIKVVQEQDLTLLGAPLTTNAVKAVFEKKLNELELLCSRLDILNKHVAYYLLKHCFGIPKLTYLLRTTPLWNFPEIVNRIDLLLKASIEKICNVQLSEYQHSVCSLPCRMGGIGIRKLEDIMLPAFLSSVNSTSSLVNSILSGTTTTDLVEVAFYEEGVAFWNAINEKIPLNGMSSQRSWDEINVLRIISSLNSPSDHHTAILTASLKPESSLWLSVLPSKNIGTLLDDNTFRISMALRLGAEMCHEYNCVCEVPVDKYGRHGLCCRKSYGKYILHRELNNIIHRTLQSANIPASLEPVGLFRDDGKRLDGMTLTPWKKGSCLVWDATCVDTLAASYINMSKVKAGRAAEQAALKKHNLYKALKERNFIILPFAVESLGPWCEEAIKFTDELGKMLFAATGEPRSKEFFKKNISLAIQRGNASKIMGSFNLSSKLNEVFYIL